MRGVSMSEEVRRNGLFDSGALCGGAYDSSRLRRIERAASSREDVAVRGRIGVQGMHYVARRGGDAHGARFAALAVDGEVQRVVDGIGEIRPP
jgi:hypothetical protein